MQEEENSGISLKEIFKTIGTQKWLCLALAVLITLACILVLNVGVDPRKREYVSTFSINLQERSGNIVYPGEDTRNYRDFVSKANLTKVKESNAEKFESVNVDAINKSSSISISLNRTDSEVTYTIRARASAFNDRNTAEEFIVAVAETPSREILKWVSGLASEIEHGFNDKLGNETKLSYLNSKLAEISQRFSTLGGISSSAGDKVSAVQDKLTTLGGVLHSKYYETDVSALESYAFTVSELERQLEVAETVLANLKGVNVDGTSQGVTIVVDSEEITAWSEKSVNLKHQIADYNKYLENYKVEGGYDFSSVTETEASKAFTESLQSALKDVTSLVSLEYDHYLKTSLISFDGANITVEGEIGLVKGLLISIVLGVVIALVASYVAGRIIAGRKAKKALPEQGEEPAEETSAETPVQEEQPAEEVKPEEEVKKPKK